MQLEDEIPPLRASLADAHEQLKQHRRKIGDLSARLLRAETALIDKAEQAEVNALAEATRRFMAKTGQTLVRPNRISPTPHLRAASFSLKTFRVSREIVGGLGGA